MDKMKRLLAFVLSLMVITTTASTLVFAEETSNEIVNEYTDVKTEEFKGRHYDAFVGMGLSTEEYVKENLDAKVTRGDFAVMLAKLMTLGEDGAELVASGRLFTDVDVYHYAAGGVQFLVERGIVAGCGDGSFCVDRPITAEEVAVMLTRVMGYGVLTEEMQAESMINSVTASIRGRYTGEVTLEECYEIIYKALFEETITLGGVENSEVVYTKGDIFLRKILKLDYFDGVLQQVGTWSLYEGKTSENQITVGGYKFVSKTDVSKDLLGFKVRVFYSEEGTDREAVAVECLDNETLTIDVRAFKEYSNNAINYYDASKKARKAKIITGKDILYNTVPVTDIASNIPKYGKIRLINNNTDSDYEVVMISGYESGVISAISEKSSIVQFKNVSPVDLTKYEIVEIVNDAGKEMSLAELYQDAVVSIYTYGTDYIRLEVSTKTVTGRIDGMRDDTKDTWKKITVDGKEYFAYWDYVTNGQKVRIEQTVKLLLDVHGRIAGIGAAGENEWKIGYIMSVKRYEDDYECLMFRILNQNGVIEKIHTTEKIRLDGEKVMASEALTDINLKYKNFAEEITLEGEKKRENITAFVMRYFIDDDGNISKVDTPVDVALYESPEVLKKMVVTEDDKLLRRVWGRLHRPESGQIYKMDFPYYTDLKGEVAQRDQNVAFIVPEAENTAPDENLDYKVTTIQALKAVHGANYYLSAYNYEPTSMLTDILVIRMGTGTSAESGMMIVDGVYKTYNADTDEVKTEITGYAGTARVTYVVNERSSTVNVNNTKVGDVISYKTQAGEAVLVDLIWRKDGTGKLKGPGIYAEDGTTKHYYAEFRVLMGTMVKLESNRGFLNLGESEKDGFITDMFTVPTDVIVYESGNEIDPCYIAPTASVLTNLGGIGEGDIVIMGQGKKAYVKTMIVIKD